MTEPTRRPASPQRPAASRRSDGLTPLALAAGLALGHVVEAMAESGPRGAATAFAAFVFVVAGTAATVCALAVTAGNGKAARARMPGWVVTVGAGVVAALAPRLF